MAQTFQSIELDVAAGVATLTLNRPERLNSLTEAMHAEIRQALEQVRGERSTRALILTGAGRGFCAGQDLTDRKVAAGEWAARPRRLAGNQLQPAGAGAARTADPGHLRRERRRRRRRREPGAELRHRDRGAFGQLHPGLLQARTGPGRGRNLLS